MNSEEIGGYVIVACYSAMLVVALKLLGIRRVLLFLGTLVLIGSAHSRPLRSSRLCAARAYSRHL